jgi:hypothetical protein
VSRPMSSDGIRSMSRSATIPAGSNGPLPSVDDDVAPLLQDQHTLNERLVQHTLAKPVQVVQVADLAATSPSGELFRQGFFKCRRGQRGRCELVTLVDRQGNRRECFAGRNWLGPLTTPSTTCGFDARIVGNSGQRSSHQRRRAFL